MVRRVAGPKSNEVYFKDLVKAVSPVADKGETVSELVDFIQRMIEDRLGSSSNAAATLKRVFEDLDGNGDGKLNESEFRRAMAGQKVSALSCRVVSCCVCPALPVSSCLACHSIYSNSFSSHPTLPLRSSCRPAT